MEIKIEPLGPHHERGAFCCGNDIIDEFCRDAIKDHDAFKQRVHVAIQPESPKILGYYCLRLIGFGKKNYSQPEIELTMIGVEKDYQNNGIGSALLAHALQRVYEVAKAVGVTMVWLDATSDDAARLYARYGFISLPDQKLKMYIPIKDIVDAIENPDR